MPHAPQCAVVEVVEVSQPLGRLASQSPQPAVQLGTQLEAAQLVVPWALLQAMPHAPQCAVVDVVGVSQPLGRLASQSPQPAVQLGTHVEAAQLVVPFGLMHEVRHEPQCVVLVASSSSQPFVALLSQSSYPGSQLLI